MGWMLTSFLMSHVLMCLTGRNEEEWKSTGKRSRSALSMSTKRLLAAFSASRVPLGVLATCLCCSNLFSPFTTSFDTNAARPDYRGAASLLPLCPMPEVANGSWVPVTLDRAPYVPRASKCYSVEHLENTTSFDYYHWHPHSSTCRYDQWDADLFCRLAHNKTVALMGDSLTWEHFSSLVGHFGRQVGAHNELSSVLDDGRRYSQQGGVILSVCNDTVRIAFKRHRYLSYVQDFLQMTDPDVIVLNRGAHHVSDQQFIDGTKSLIALMEQHQEKCRQQGRNCLALWRTTAPGHPRCANYSKPETNALRVEELLAYQPNKDPERYPGKKHYYYWWDFNRINKIIVKMFQNSTLLSFDYLPAYDANLLRPDAHVGPEDCLHNCDPGAVDVYNVFMLHALRMHYSLPSVTTA